MTDPTPIPLGEVEAAAKAATEGRWEVDERDLTIFGGDLATVDVASATSTSDATHIATSDPPTVLAIIDALRDAESALEELPGPLADGTRQRIHDLIDFGDPHAA